MEVKIIWNDKETMVIGHICPTCGKEHKWSVYVFAHYDIELVHTCDCGQKVHLCSGEVQTEEDYQQQIDEEEDEDEALLKLMRVANA
jgi:Zn ribbon nucleic-acid-binding protein